MSNEHEIKYCTPILYNIVFNEKDKVNHEYSYETEKCIYLDTEQEGLLRKLMSEEDTFIMEFDGDNVN